MLSLVKYSCGCIGLPKDDEDGHAIIFDSCDKDIQDYDQYSMFYRDMKDKTFEPLRNVESERNIVKEIGQLIHLGYRMRDLASTMRMFGLMTACATAVGSSITSSCLMLSSSRMTSREASSHSAS